MLKLLQSFFLSLSIGIVVCLSTAFLCGLYGSMLDKESSFSEMAWLVLICAGVFATPAVILWWAGVNLLALRYKQNPQFFNRVLLLSAAIALCVSIVFCYLYNDVQPVPAQVVLLVVVATTCISVWLHRSLLFFLFPPVKKISDV